MAETVLILKHGALGDLVIESGLIHAIVDRHPGAEISLMTHASLVKIMDQSGWFSEFFVDNRGKYTFRELKRICKTIFADRKFDYIYDLQSSDRTLHIYYAVSRFLTRNPMNWGRLAPGGFDFYRTPSKRAYSWGRATVEHVDVTPLPADISFCHGEHANFHLLPERYALLFPGCSAKNPQKRWPAERYREISMRLGARGIKTVVAGTTAEAAEISAIAKGNPHAVDFMGKSSIIDIPDLARGALVVVGNDTGPSHMSRLSGAKTIMLFNEYDKRAAAVMPNVINIDNVRVSDIQVDEVMSAVDQMLEGGGVR